MDNGFLGSKVLRVAKRVAAAGAVAAALLVSHSALAITALKQVQVSNGSQVDLLFDGKVQKAQIQTEFVGDVIQISIQDVSVYPAKISSVNGGALTKIFAYQYAPKLVRCRLTVKGKAEEYRSKLEIKANGRILTVKMPGASRTETAKASPARGASEKGSLKSARNETSSSGDSGESGATSEPDEEERALLSRVMSAGAPAAQAAAKNGSKEAAGKAEAGKAEAQRPEARAEKATDRSPAEKPSKDSITVSSAAAVAAPPADGAPHTESLPVHLTGEGAALGGARPLPSPWKAFGKMGLVLGLFGLMALALKRFAKSKAQSRSSAFLSGAKRSGRGIQDGSWLDAIGRFAKKGLGRDSKMIEVLSTHYLGPKQSIAVVRVAGRVLVLGVSNESINLITQLSGQAGAEALGDELGEALGGGDLGFGEAEADLGPSVEPAISKRAAPTKGSGATAAGNALFADLLKTERAKPAPASGQAFGNPSGHGAYSAAAQHGPSAQVSRAPTSAEASVRAKIRNRLEGMKPL